MSWAAVLLLGAACAGDGSSPDQRPSASSTERDLRPNVLLISLDTLRADRLGSYGYSRDTSPFLDQLAARGLRFENAFVNTHGTPPSHATLFTSLYQQTHRVSLRRDGQGALDHRMPDHLPVLPEELRKAGYRTVAVVGGGFISDDFGFDRGFERFVETPGIESQVERLAREVERISNEGRPTFAFLHTYEIHSPYAPPDEYALRFVEKATSLPTSNAALLAMRREGRIPSGDDLRYLSDLYDAGIRYTDDHLRRLFDELEAMGFFDHHVTVVTSDHGEEFAEHGGLLHPATLYEEIVRIPLLISGTRIRPNLVQERLVSTIDIAPTLYRLAGEAGPPGLQGRDLLRPRPRGADPAVFMQYRDVLAAIRTHRHKLIVHRTSGRARLFDLRADPRETRDLLRQHPRIVESLRSRLEAWLEATTPGGGGEEPSADGPDAERLEQLRALGYVD